MNIDTEDNRPKTGATFHQKETVAGLFADLRGHFLYVEKPRITVWRGIATYKVLGGEKAVYDHTYKELVFFKKHLDRTNPPE
ncbi:MAG: hypothetical protein Q8M95_05305 [Candidatus Methanoperedens sp.]|nr:hypothetical protein [Candidatus Methanoperedenaceae archaeon]MDP3104007.1 hypothetical protein [Candidatus Methanoperedens sp.]